MAKNTRHNKKNGDFKLQTLRKKDLPSLLELEKRLFPIDQWSEDIFIDEVEKDPHSIKVVKIKDQVIGYVHTELTERKVKNNKIVRIGEIGSVAVREDYRGNKLGEKLVKHGISRLKRKSSHKIILHTRLDNIPMQKLASSKFGFKTSKIRKNAYDDGASAYEMVLPLK